MLKRIVKFSSQENRILRLVEIKTSHNYISKDEALQILKDNRQIWFSISSEDLRDFFVEMTRLGWVFRRFGASYKFDESVAYISVDSSWQSVGIDIDSAIDDLFKGISHENLSNLD
jgi:hypothetical protein